MPIATPGRDFTSAEMWIESPPCRLPMTSFLDMLKAALAEPRHNIVYYRGATGETRFLTPDDFLWAPCGGPSDCVWIVPGEVPHR